MRIERKHYPLPDPSVEHRCFDAATLKSDSTWKMQGSRALIVERTRLGEWAADNSDCIERYQPGMVPLPEVQALAGAIRQRLDNGFGLAWVSGMPIDGDLRAASLLYLAVGASMGEVDETYGRLYDVVDLGESYKNRAIPVSQTRESTGMHTDSSRLNNVPDYVGLLCLRQGDTGGGSRVVSGAQAHQALRRRGEDLLEPLYRDYVRDIVTPGANRHPATIAANRFPIFQYQGALTLRYMRYWIEKGHRISGVPLRDEEIRAMDALDEELSRDKHMFHLKLSPGDMLWVANRVVAHDRDAYTDNPACPRWLQRQWVRIKTN